MQHTLAVMPGGNMLDDFPLHRFEEFGALTCSERRALADASEPPVQIRRRANIRHEGIKPVGFFLLCSGWATSAHTLPDGGRQNLKVHVPGDALGTPSMCMVQTVEELSALTDVTVSHVSLSRFASLCEAHPRLAMKVMLSVQLERVALMDRLSSIGRTSAVQRIAALILDLLERLKPVGQVHGDTFSMALTQEEIGDIVGLTPVHTNRALKALTEEGLISRRGKEFKVVDLQQLAAVAAMPTRHPHVDAPWLPQAR